ncbi:hypothetical protein Rctr85_087 [Virus Rctr85]|nr:hypothetical protein Rctr85_087 [Virus Rctr85]
MKKLLKKAFDWLFPEEAVLRSVCIVVQPMRVTKRDENDLPIEWTDPIEQWGFQRRRAGRRVLRFWNKVKLGKKNE